MNISLILATYGRTEDLDRLLQSLMGQDLKDFELIVVDQNLDDRILRHVEMARRALVSVVYLRQATPNLSAARNLGLAHAVGEVVGFPDDDCWYEPTVISQVKAAFEARPDCDGIVAQWVEQTAARNLKHADELLSLARWRQFRDGDASSISLFFKAAALRQVGGFDERLGVGQWFGSAEETDLMLTLLSQGGPVARWPAARVHHRYGARDDVSFMSQLRRARGVGALYAKHQLSWAVVLRGLLAPPLVALVHWRGTGNLLLSVAVSVGRCQGALAWLVQRGAGKP